MPIDNPSEPVTPGVVAVGRKVPAYPGRVLAPLPEALAARLRPDAVCSDPEILRSYALDGAPGLPATEDFTLVRARDRADVVAVLEVEEPHRSAPRNRQPRTRRSAAYPRVQLAARARRG